jgi:hypothetical protein
MKKIVVNQSHGACCLSADAVYLLMRLGFPVNVQPIAETNWTEAEFIGEGPDGFRSLADDYEFGALLKDGLVYCYGWSRGTPEADALRSHPALVKVAEVLGKRATVGRYNGRLGILELADDARYRITDYDNAEGVQLLAPEDYTLGHPARDLDAPPVPEDGWFAAASLADPDD